MLNDIPENLLRDISGLIGSQTGLHFPPKKWSALKKAAQNTAAAHGMNVRDFMEGLLSPCADGQMLNALVNHLTIGETYFLRDKHLFQLLKDHIIHDLVTCRLGNNEKINILSAGCASGEEPYSIAILIDQSFPAIRKKDITIIGTDINSLFLEKARKGIYSQWSLRETPDTILTRYFTPSTSATFALSSHIRDRVRFVHLNLVENDYTAHLNFREPFHIVLCRNVLMYFDDGNRMKVISKLTGIMAENGWLITGPAETGFIQSSDLIPVRCANTLLHRKSTSSKTIRRNDLTPAWAQHPPEPEPRRRQPRPAPLKTGIKTPYAGIADEKPGIVQYQEALDLYEKGEYTNAASMLERLITRNNAPGASFLMATEAMMLLARSYANLGMLKIARYWCEQAVASEKLNPEIHFLQATILQDAGDVPAAVQSMKQALFLDPEFIMAHFMLGLLVPSPAGEKSLQNALGLLKNRDPEEVLPFSEGITAARLTEMIYGMIRNKGRA
jgi:chemotaxis protein methyltransferase CheR